MVHRLSGLDSEAAGDLAGGQIVIVIARWLLILSGLVITLWSPPQSDLDKVRVSVFVLLALAAGNFYLHAQILMRRPVPAALVYAASTADIFVITLITLAYGGFDARIFVFYYPALIAFALVFPFSVTVAFTGLILALYTAVSFTGLSALPDLQVLAQRLISMVAVAMVANIYLRIERGRGAAGLPLRLGEGRDEGTCAQRGHE